MSVLRFIATATLAFILCGCIKDKKIPMPLTQPAQQQAYVVFDFTATANNRRLVPDSVWYTNPGLDSFTVTKFNYYISNIQFTRSDGAVYAEPNSYRINRHADGPCTFTVSGVPAGTYNSIRFSIGVDSLRNSGGAQTGGLDISQGMYWDWATGYVFFKLEGDFKTARFTTRSEYAMHVGTNANLQTCTFNLGAAPVSATLGKQSTVYYNVNIDEVLTHPQNLDFDSYHAVSGGPQAAVISKNYRDMFSITRVEN